MSAGATASPLRRALRNAGYLVAGTGAGAVMGVATTALAARTLGLEGFGVLLLINAFAGSVSAATRLQSWQPLLQFGSAWFHAGETGEFQTLLRHAMMLDGLGAVAGVAIGLPLAWLAGPWLGWGGHGVAAVAYVTVVLFMNTGSAMGMMRLSNRFKIAAAADTVGAAVRLAGTLAGMLLHWRLPAFLAVWYLATVTAFIIDALVLRRIVRRTPSLAGFRLTGVSWRSRVRGIWKLTVATSGNQALIGLSSKLGILLVGAALGPGDAALYRVTAQIGEAVSQPVQLLTPALYPEFVRLRDRQEWPGLRRIVWRVLQGLAAFSVLALLVAVVAGPWLLATLLGVHRPHVLALLLLMTAAAVVDLWDVPLEPLLVALGRAKQLLYGRLGVMLLSLPLLYGLSRLAGLEGAAAASLLREAGIFLSRLLPFLALP